MPGDQGAEGRMGLPAVFPHEIGQFHDRGHEADGGAALMLLDGGGQTSEVDAAWVDWLTGLNGVDVPIGMAAGSEAARLVSRSKR